MLLSVLFIYRLVWFICCNLFKANSLFVSLQCPASPSLLPSLYGHLQCPAGLRGWPCSDGILRSGSSPGSAACGLCPLCCLSEPPGPPWVCLQAAWAPGSPSAYYHPADVPGVLGNGQSSFASLIFFASFFIHAVILKQLISCYMFWLVIQSSA